MNKLISITAFGLDGLYQAPTYHIPEDKIRYFREEEFGDEGESHYFVSIEGVDKELSLPKSSYLIAKSIYLKGDK